MKSYVFLVFALLSFTFVFSSEVSKSFEENQEIREWEKLKEVYISTPGQGKERCENRNSLHDAIKCRLQLNINYEDFPHMCEYVSDSESCLDLHKFSTICFEVAPKDELHQCLKDVAQDEREYLVLLLQLLERDVTNSYLYKDLGLNDASSLKYDILTTQISILNGEDKFLIENNIQKLENKWRVTIR